MAALADLRQAYVDAANAARFAAQAFANLAAVLDGTAEDTDPDGIFRAGVRPEYYRAGGRVYRPDEVEIKVAPPRSPDG